MPVTHGGLELKTCLFWACLLNNRMSTHLTYLATGIPTRLGAPRWAGEGRINLSHTRLTIIVCSFIIDALHIPPSIGCTVYYKAV